MNKYLVMLKGTDKDMSAFELETLWQTYFNEKITLIRIQNMCYFIESNIDIKPEHEIFKRITFTNYFGKLLLETTNIEEYIKYVQDNDFSMLENKTFLIRNKKMRHHQESSNYLEKELAKPIWQKLSNPKVTILNPDFEYNFFYKENHKEIFFALKIFENTKDYMLRQPKFRPIKMPYTLKSDLARIAINYLGLKQGLILDPFAGIGGILIEAKDMNFNIIANDISWNDLKYLKLNLEHYFKDIKPLRVLCDSKDQFLKDNSIDGIVTDIPYGKCSRRLGDDLYNNFLRSAQKYLKPKSRIVIIYANFLNFKDIATKYFKEVIQVDHYINKSMTRHILVLEKE